MYNYKALCIKQAKSLIWIVFIVLFLQLFPQNTLAKPGFVYHICRDTNLIVLAKPDNNSSIVYRVQKGDYLKEIDSSGEWVEVGIIEAGHKETCCGFGWLPKIELISNSKDCKKP